MALERIPPDLLMVELLDRVLDKGIVIDAAHRFSAVGIPLIDVQSHVVIAAVNTNLQHIVRPSVMRSDQLRVVQIMRQ